MSTQHPSSRLASLDILRGFDLFLLVFLQPILYSLGQHLHAPFMTEVLYHFDHEVWEGFRFWDLVMPLFLFMAGVSMPFSLGKYKETLPPSAAYKKIFRRFFLLFLLGMVVQGNLLGWDWNHLYIYTNTLQAIATGYLVAALVFLNFKSCTQLVIMVAFLIIYWVPMTFCGDFTPEGNFANCVDQWVLGRFRGDPSYTWIWSSWNFSVTVLLGTFAGKLMKNGKDSRGNTAICLWVVGLLLVGVGWLWSGQMPIIKRLWTSSMTLLSGGYCFLLMGLFYYVIDCKGWSRGWGWLKYYGMNSILAYMLGETVNFRSIAYSLSYGLQPYMGDYYAVWIDFFNFFILFLILRHCYRHQIFLKV